MNTTSPIAASRPTMNPYRYAAQLIWHRLRWDLTWESFRSRRRLKAIKDSWPGGKAVIVCNGPSLLKTDFSLLDGVFTFGLNKINLLFDRSPFRPNVVVAINPLVIEQNRDFFNRTQMPLFIDGGSRRQIAARSNVTFLNMTTQSKMARDCSVSMNHGCTVTVVALQLAFHMGFRNVALVGCDHNFSTKGAAHQTVTAHGADASHFDPRYFSGGQRWQLPDLAASEYYYSLAADTYAAFGGKITNCTDGGKLELFERSGLREWLAAT